MRIKNTILATAAALLFISCSSENEAPLVSGVDLDAVDRNTRPQDDFYQFVNGSWLDSTEIPDIYSGYTVYHEVRERVELTLREIINEAADSPGEKGSESQQVGDIYGSWMDTETIDAATLAPALAELDTLQSIDSVESLTLVMAQLFRKGVEVPYTAEIYPDLEDSSRYTVYLWQAGLTMPDRDYYLELDNENFTKARAGLGPYIAKMLDQAGMDPAAAADVYALEIEIAVAQWDSVRNRDPQAIYNPYKSMRCKNLVRTCSGQVRWQRWASTARKRLLLSSQVISRLWTRCWLRFLCAHGKVTLRFEFLTVAPNIWTQQPRQYASTTATVF